MEATHLDSTARKSIENANLGQDATRGNRVVKRLMPKVLGHCLRSWISKLGDWVRSWIPSSAGAPVSSSHPTAEHNCLFPALRPLAAAQDSTMPFIEQPPEAAADDTALKALVKAFGRWQREESGFRDESSGSITAYEVSALDNQAPITKPSAFAFLQSLHAVELDELPEDERHCEICIRAYGPMSDQERNLEICVATRLPCNHVVGSFCISKWLWPVIDAAPNSCPYCRRALFPKMASIRMLEGLQQRVDLSDWCAERFRRVPSAREQRLLASWTRSIVEFRITGALWELDKKYKKGVLVAKEATDENIEAAKADYAALLAECKERKKTIDRIKDYVKMSDQEEMTARDIARRSEADQRIRRGDQAVPQYVAPDLGQD